MYKQNTKYGFSLKYFFLLLLPFTVLKAEVLQFFDPSGSRDVKNLHFQSAYFIANDPISLKEFFDDWSQDYHPKKGENLALQDFRLDIGGTFLQDYYFGYYYRYNVFIRTNKDFTDFYYTAKNKLPFERQKNYRLNLEIEGVTENGLLLSRSFLLLNDTQEKLTIGFAFSVAFGLDMQNGDVSGTARILNKKSYEIDAKTNYYYTHNYLYDLDVKNSDGFGFASHFALSYVNHYYQFYAKVIVNDLFSRMYWSDLPYSYVNLQTKNKSYDENGYVKYAPIINGVERYTDFTQKIDPRYKMMIEKEFVPHQIRLLAGAEYAYAHTFPYLGIEKAFFDGNHYAGIKYESRFKTVELSYRNRYFSIGIASDALHTFSAFGLYGNFIYRF